MKTNVLRVIFAVLLALALATHVYADAGGGPGSNQLLPLLALCVHVPVRRADERRAIGTDRPNCPLPYATDTRCDCHKKSALWCWKSM